jgi:hypothetical protein
MSNINLNRAQLAKFLPSPQAIKAFEGLFKAVADGLPSSLEDVEATAGAAQQQAGEALAALAVVANQLALLLLAPSQESVASDSYGPPTDFSSHLDLYVPPAEPNNFYNPASVKITGGTIDGAVIGGTAPAAGTFSSLGLAAAANAAFGLSGGATKTAYIDFRLGGVLKSNIACNGAVAGTPLELNSAAAGDVLAVSGGGNFRVGGSTGSGEKLQVVGSTGGVSSSGAKWMFVYKTSGLSNSSGLWQDSSGNTELALRNAAGSVGVSMKSSGNSSLPGNLDISGALTVSSSTLIRSTTTLSNGAGAAAGTLANAPVAGNPTKWIPINDNGTTRYIPAW